MSAADRVELLRSLAAMLRAGIPLGDALSRWPEQAPTAVAPLVRRVARRAALGARPTSAFRALEPDLGHDAAAVAEAVEVAVATGADPAAALDGVAAWIGERERLAQEAKSTAAGMALSAKIVAGLPLAFLPLLPGTRASMFDGTGIVLLATGIALALAGLRWIDRLLPRPPVEDDPGATVARRVAFLMRGGIGLTDALDAVSRQPPPELRQGFGRVHRAVALGSSWPGALGRAADDALRELGRVLDAAMRNGTPVVEGLESLARERRSLRARRFDAAVRKAPVKMVTPLVLCVLPSFCLIALGPFLRSIAL